MPLAQDLLAEEQQALIADTLAKALNNPHELKNLFTFTQLREEDLRLIQKFEKAGTSFDPVTLNRWLNACGAHIASQLFTSFGEIKPEIYAALNKQGLLDQLIASSNEQHIKELLCKAYFETLKNSIYEFHGGSQRFDSRELDPLRNPNYCWQQALDNATDGRFVDNNKALFNLLHDSKEKLEQLDFLYGHLLEKLENIEKNPTAFLKAAIQFKTCLDTFLFQYSQGTIAADDIAPITEQFFNRYKKNHPELHYSQAVKNKLAVFQHIADIFSTNSITQSFQRELEEQKPGVDLSKINYDLSTFLSSLSRFNCYFDNFEGYAALAEAAKESNDIYYDFLGHETNDPHQEWRFDSKEEPRVNNEELVKLDSFLYLNCKKIRNQSLTEDLEQTTKETTSVVSRLWKKLKTADAKAALLALAAKVTQPFLKARSVKDPAAKASEPQTEKRRGFIFKNPFSWLPFRKKPDMADNKPSTPRPKK